LAPSLAGAARRSSGLAWGRLLLAVTVAAGIWLASRAGLHF
jgi:hypothetical protein